MFSQIARNAFPYGEKGVWPDESSVGTFLSLTGNTSCILQEFLTIFVSVLTALLIPFLGTDLGSAFAAGAMLYVVVEELVPEYSQGNHSNVGTIGFALG
ncbi:MAG: hypothetical protein SPG05_02000 [Candidatus Cryptobacteroides sp.]|nr:hypothetical protein [Candidatus Cryptobacteroides sp.]